MYKSKAASSSSRRGGLHCLAAFTTIYLLTTVSVVSSEKILEGSPCYELDEQDQPILTKPEVRKPFTCDTALREHFSTKVGEFNDTTLNIF